MPIESDLLLFSRLGQGLLALILALSLAAGVLGVLNLVGRRPVAQAWSRPLAWLIAGLLVAGFLLIGWLSLRIYQRLPLKLPSELVPWLNQGLTAMNVREGAGGYGLPLLDPASPPRYLLPLWIENGKYYFWFMGYALMLLPALSRPLSHRLRGALLVVLALQNAILFFLANPFSHPLPKFMAEIGPWFSGGLDPLRQLRQFMRLYPRMLFYYNTPYMWLHPPMLFLSYAAITVTFVASLFMLAGRRPEIEALGYDHAKFGYFMLTLGMLLGYPWALEAWGPNWWWDPKICSSIMMWAIYSTYLHTRLYAHRKGMWYFTAFLGIVCFAAMIFTLLTSFYFPGEHTGQ